MRLFAGLLAASLVAAGLGSCGGAADHTPLQRAAMSQQADTVDALLDQGASVGAENHRKRTALHYAVLRREPQSDYSLRMVRALLAHGADPNHTDNRGRAPIDLAIERGTHDVVRALLANGADPNRIDRNGLSLLALAMMHGRMDVADSLKEFGARHGVSPRETELMPHLPQVTEFSKRIRGAWESNDNNPEALPGIVRQVAAVVYPEMSEGLIKWLVGQAGSLVAADRMAQGECFKPSGEDYNPGDWEDYMDCTDQQYENKRRELERELENERRELEEKQARRREEAKKARQRAEDAHNGAP